MRVEETKNHQISISLCMAHLMTEIGFEKSFRTRKQKQILHFTIRSTTIRSTFLFRIYKLDQLLPDFNLTYVKQ